MIFVGRCFLSHPDCYAEEEGEPDTKPGFMELCTLDVQGCLALHQQPTNTARVVRIGEILLNPMYPFVFFTHK